MDEGNFYFNVPVPDPDMSKKDTAINSLLNTFLRVREVAQFPSNCKGFDEDVNLYVAHLLFAISMPNYNTITEQYISLHDAEVRVLADMAEDKYLQYFIFKVNADNLLLHLGIFQDLCHHPHEKSVGKETKDYISDAKDFYLKSVQLNKSIYRRKTAIADVLLKLSKYLDHYVRALSMMRKEFYLFLNRFEDIEFSNFLDHMRTYERRMEFEQKQNIFLDLYSQWLKKKTNVLKVKINTLCRELHEMDTSFTFNLD